jgi:hypothetical protein
MNVEEMTELVKQAVEDESFTDEFILSAFNQCVGELATAYTLPVLVANTTVDCPAGANTVPMPDNYLKNMHFASNLSKECRVSIIKALTNFLDKYPFLDAAPPVTEVCVQGNTLYFQGVPSAPETLRLFYIRKPSPLVEDEDEPEGIPESLHRKLLVNFACAECFNLIEEGIDGAKIQFNKYTSLYQQAQVQLEAFLGVPPESPDYVPREEKHSSFDV